VTGWGAIVLLGAVCFVIVLLLWVAFRSNTKAAKAEVETYTVRREAVRTAESLQDVVDGQRAAAEVRSRDDRTPADIVRENGDRWP